MRGHSFNIAAIVLLSALTLTSCSRSPLAPEVATDPATTSFAGIQIDDTPGGIAGQAGVVGSIVLTAGQTGTLHVGRFTLVVPKNALQKDATITLRQPDIDVMQVEFQVLPADANHFARPVQLIADCSNDPLSELETETLFWMKADWAPAAGVQLDRTHRTLSTRTRQLSNGKVDARGTHAAGHDGDDDGDNDDHEGGDHR